MAKGKRLPIDQVNINGKTLKRDHYILLRKLGIEIVMYDLKTYVDHSTSGMHQTTNGLSFGFTIDGAIHETVDFDELYELLVLLKAARDSDCPAVEDALNNLRTVIGLSNDE